MKPYDNWYPEEGKKKARRNRGESRDKCCWLVELGWKHVAFIILLSLLLCMFEKSIKKVKRMKIHEQVLFWTNVQHGFCWVSQLWASLRWRGPWNDGRGKCREAGITPPPTTTSGGSDGSESACNAGDLGLIPGLGRSPGEGNGYPLQYFYLENTLDKGAWWVTVHEVTKSQTWLSD